MSLSPDVANAVAIWVETLLYGLYTCLYFQALYIMTRRSSRVAPIKVFLTTTIAMHLVATVHITVNCYRLLRAFVIHVDPMGSTHYFISFNRWDNITHYVLICVMTWLGDALVLYRCYIVWNHNYYTIVLPAILLGINISINIFLIYWFQHGDPTEFPKVTPWLNSVYPLAFVENVLTTGLIALKIWQQHCASMKVGITDRSSRHSLFNVLRIIVESAMIYTIQLMILIILYPLEHPAQAIIQSAIVPSIGIVFVLIAVRVHLTGSKTILEASHLSIPSWLDDSSRERADSDHRSDHRMKVLNPFRSNTDNVK